MTRQQELGEKLTKVRAFMEKARYDAALFTSDQNFGWLGCGAADLVDHSNEIGRGFAGILVTRDHAYVLANNIEMPRLLAEEVNGLDLEPVEYPWTDGSSEPTVRRLLTQGGRGARRFAADTVVEGATDERERLGLLRTPLSEIELERFRSLCSTGAAAMAATIAAIRPGMSEIEIGAVAGDEVLKRGAFPTLILVGTDERILRFRHPVPTARTLDRYCMVVICAQKWGLVSSLTRLLHFGSFPKELSRRYEALLSVEHSLITATTAGTTLSEVFEVGRRAYSSAGFEGEERKHFQGGTCGYYGREQELAPGVGYRIQEGEVFAHNPSITGVKIEDTILSRNGGFEILTEIADWPCVERTQSGVTLRRPEVLIR